MKRKAIYGDRLEGIEEVEITSKEQDNIISKLEEKAEVKKAEVDIKGRILNFIITVNDDVELDAAKALTGTITDTLEKEQTRFMIFKYL